MAGSFGYEAEHYALSMKIRNLSLFPAIKAKETTVIANGVSCRAQIADGTNRRALHLAEVVARSLHEFEHS